MSHSEALPSEAEELKRLGNDAFRAKNFAKAGEYFSKAIEIAPHATLYSNLAAALLNEDCLLEAASACREAIKLDETWPKPHARLSTINEMLRKSSIAVDSCFHAWELETDPAAKAEYAKMLMKLRRKYLVLPVKFGDGISPDNFIIDSPEMQKHPAFRAQQLVKEGKATFDEFSEGARIYAAFARVAQINEVMALPPFQTGLIAEFLYGIMISMRGFHQVTRRRTSTPLEVLQQQLSIEQRMTEAVGPNLSPVDVINEYDIRRTQRGWTWERTNAALELSIASAGISGATTMFLANDPGSSVDYWRRVVDLIEVGKKKWDGDASARLRISRWISIPMLRAAQCQLIDGICRHFEITHRPELLSTFPEAFDLADDVIDSALSEEFDLTNYPTLTDYAAFSLEHLVVAYRQRGMISGRFSIMILFGAKVDGPAPQKGRPKQKTQIWRSPASSRKAASDYLSAAAFAADDDPQRLAYFYYAISNMCHSGHVALGDLVSLGELIEQSLKDCQLLFGDDPESINHDHLAEVRVLMKKVEKLLKTSGVTPDRRLKPCPDYDSNKDTTVAEIKPELFEAGEDEALWRTPDGKFVEINPIFAEFKEDHRKSGWIETAKLTDVLQEVQGRTSEAKTIQGDKSARKHGWDDWSHLSYMEYYKEARTVRDNLKRRAQEIFAKAKAEM